MARTTLRFRRSALAAAVGRACPLGAGQASALPSGGTVTYGDATIVSDPATGTVTIDASASSGTNGNTVIEWSGGFNLAAGEAANFLVSRASSIVVNYDVTGTLSLIDGAIQSAVAGSGVTGGIIVVANPAGVSVGPNTSISAGAFAAFAAGPGAPNFGLDTGFAIALDPNGGGAVTVDPTAGIAPAGMGSSLSVSLAPDAGGVYGQLGIWTADPAVVYAGAFAGPGRVSGVVAAPDTQIVGPGSWPLAVDGLSASGQVSIINSADIAVTDSAFDGGLTVRLDDNGGLTAGGTISLVRSSVTGDLMLDASTSLASGTYLVTPSFGVVVEDAAVSGANVTIHAQGDVRISRSQLAASNMSIEAAINPATGGPGSLTIDQGSLVDGDSVSLVAAGDLYLGASPASAYDPVTTEIRYLDPSLLLVSAGGSVTEGNVIWTCKGCTPPPSGSGSGSGSGSSGGASTPEPVNDTPYGPGTDAGGRRDDDELRLAGAVLVCVPDPTGGERCTSLPIR